MSSHILVGFSTKRGSFLGWATRFFTRWRHSHIVLIHEDGDRLLEATDEGGVREMPIEYLLQRDDVEIRMIPHPNPALVWEIATTKIGVEYDELYSWGYLFHSNWQDPNKLACSEFLECCCREAGKALFPGVDGHFTARDFYLISKPL